MTYTAENPFDRICPLADAHGAMQLQHDWTCAIEDWPMNCEFGRHLAGFGKPSRSGRGGQFTCCPHVTFYHLRPVADV